MGMSCMLQARQEDRPSKFIPPKWAYKYNAEDLPHLGGDDQGLALGAHRAQELGEVLGLDGVHAQIVHHDHAALGGLGAQGADQGQAADLAVEGVAVIPGLGGECDAAVGPHGAALVAGAGAAGALLAPGLLGGVADLALA